jgi:hypothetical protein
VGIFSHSRHRVFSQAQHPFTHNIEDIVYSHPSVTGSVTTLAQAMNHLFAVLYPTAKEAVATKADLPTTGNSIGDMRVVINDNDNKSASYRFELREGDDLPGKWYKIYDLDFSSDSILASWQNVTQDQYIQKRGRDDTDVNGDPITGVLAGQSVWGGKSANTSLNLYANSGDGNGPSTGWIQVGDNVRPIGDDKWSLGEPFNRFKHIHSKDAFIGELSLADNAIVSSTGEITLDDNNLLTTGVLVASHIFALSQASKLASGTSVGDVSIGDGYVQSASGLLSFGNNDLLTNGTASIGDITIGANQIDSDTGIIDFALCDLVSVNSIEASLGVFEAIEVGLPANKLEIGSDGNITKDTPLTLSTPAITVTGFVDLLSELSVASSVEAGGAVKSNTGLIATDNAESKYVSVEGGDIANKITSFGNALDVISPVGMNVDTPFVKPLGAATDLGDEFSPFRHLAISGELKFSTGAINQETLHGLRNSVTRANGDPALAGDSLFWSDAAQCWYADHPDTEITHGQISGLTNDDHPQYLRLAGRGSGQLVYGGIIPNANLTLGSTLHATKGLVLFRDVLAPETDGTNLGTASRQIGDSFHKGQAIGLRAENVTTVTLPSPSASKTGRVVYDATAKTLLVDDGGMWRRAGAEKVIVQDDLYWDGSQLSKTYTIGTQLQDATKAIWEFGLTSTGERLYPTITKTTTSVTVTFKAAPPAASYTLIGVA